jgi:hypothetical protein
MSFFSVAFPLLIIVLSFVEFIVYNEEVLLMLCFVSFILYAYHTVGGSVEDNFTSIATSYEQKLTSSYVKDFSFILSALQYNNFSGMTPVIDVWNSLCSAFLFFLVPSLNQPIFQYFNNTLENFLSLIVLLEQAKVNNEKNL